MIYCNKCARILDADMDICPYCGSADESENKPEQGEWQHENDAVLGGAPGFGDDLHTTMPDAIDARSAELDMMFGKVDDVVWPEVEAPQPQSEPEVLLPEPEAEAEAPPYQPEAPEPLPNNGWNGQKETVIHETVILDNTNTDDVLSLGAKIGIVIISLIIPVVGVIAGIILMVRQERGYRKFGQTLLTIVVVEMLLGCVCCCVFSAVGGLSDMQYWVYRLMVNYG